jgi:hypothetical protein
MAALCQMPRRADANNACAKNSDFHGMQVWWKARRIKSKIIQTVTSLVLLIQKTYARL